jgi:hypothetical protein
VGGAELHGRAGEPTVGVVAGWGGGKGAPTGEGGGRRNKSPSSVRGRIRAGLETFFWFWALKYKVRVEKRGGLELPLRSTILPYTTVWKWLVCIKKIYFEGSDSSMGSTGVWLHWNYEK